MQCTYGAAQAAAVEDICGHLIKDVWHLLIERAMNAKASRKQEFPGF